MEFHSGAIEGWLGTIVSVRGRMAVEPVFEHSAMKTFLGSVRKYIILTCNQIFQ